MSLVTRFKNYLTPLKLLNRKICGLSSACTPFLDCRASCSFVGVCLHLVVTPDITPSSSNCSRPRALLNLGCYLTELLP